MDLEYFSKALNDKAPPTGLSEYLQALWFDGNGDWESAHHLIQDIETRDASWIHAYLHRKEGDNSNAGYWYHKAGKIMPPYSLEQEWKELVSHFLQ